MSDYSYCSVKDVKDRLDIQDTTTSDDAMILSIVRAATRYIDQHYGARRFVPETAAKRFDGSGTKTLFIPDLLAVTTLVDDTDTWTSSDYLLYPRNAGGTNGPYTYITIDPDGTYSAFTEERDIVVITGRWGSYEETATTGATLATAITSTTATTISVATGSIIRPGHVLLIDDEQLFVTTRSAGENDTYTVVRGVNGTTAATHTQGTAINYYLAPWEIFELCVELASRLYKMKDTAYQDATGSIELGELQYRRAARAYLKAEAPLGWYRARMGRA
ncbi:MAG: hypothetical protein PVJ86_00340 [Phycisphaerales bacterium]|jgi:hypothetical protein